MPITQPIRYYSEAKEVRTRFPTVPEEDLPDRSINKALQMAGAMIDEAGRRGGYTVPFSYCPNTPVMIAMIAEEFAAGWVLTRPQFSACTEKVPANGQLMLDWAQAQLDLLAAGSLMIDDAAPEPGSGVGVISSGVNGEGYKERIKQFPFYQPPAYPIDPLPVVHPQHGSSYDNQYRGRW